MVSIVARGPYIGDLSSELRRQEPAEILQNARNLLDRISDSQTATNFLTGQIESLNENTATEIKNIPDFSKLHTEEINLQQSPNNEDATNLLEAIKLIRQAFSLQRFLHQTKEITPTEQMNFAKLLNRRIDPITKSGVRSKEKKAPDKFQPFQETLSGMSDLILKVPSTLLVHGSRMLDRLKLEFWKDGNIKNVADALYSILSQESTGLFGMLKSQTPDHLKASLEPVWSSIVGGLDNAMAVHLAFIKVAFAQLQKMIPDDDNTFQAKWDNVLKNLSHISKQFASVQGMTLKLVENLNGTLSNQGKAYDFNPDNFELLLNKENLVLVPTLDFLQKVITHANDNATVVRSVGSLSIPVEHNFAESYYFPNGCPIHGAQGSIQGKNFKLDEKYFEVMDLITESVFAE